jgi:two-component system phosphate regulon response regulator PhoB/two-component system alkaline phosphatase synthesis response regulator PhoP
MAMKVLVVEDDGFLLKAYQLKLSKAGFDLQTASDGEEAIKVLATFKPDVILLDLVMPRKDGFATLEEIKKDDTLKSIPVLVTSNLGQKEEIDRVMNLGAEDFLIKSNMSMDSLVEKIKKLATR